MKYPRISQAADEREFLHSSAGQRAEAADQCSKTALADDEIAHRAYSLYLAEGSLPGQDLAHWLKAEAQLRAEFLAAHPLPTETKNNGINKTHMNTIPATPPRTANASPKPATPPAPNGVCTNAAIDLSKHAPHSPRERLAGFVLANRAIDKCRASVAGTLGEYHFNCPMDNVLFSFKGITSEEFKTAVQAAKTSEQVGAWLLAHGLPKTPAEIKAWSDKVEASRISDDPAKRAYFEESCTKLGLDPKKATTFDWLEADDRASFCAKCA